MHSVKNNGNRNRSNGGARAGLLGNGPRAVPPAWRGQQPQARHQLPPATPAATKIFISNLPLDVEENSITELMETTVGPLKGTSSFFNKAGRPTGMAMVHFAKPNDAIRAKALYNNKVIDNQKAIKVELIGDLAHSNGLPYATLPPAAPRTLFERLRVPTGPAPRGPKHLNAPALQQYNAQVIQAQALPMQQRVRRKKGPKRIQKGNANTAPFTRKSAAQLDREMEEYRAVAPIFVKMAD